MAGIDGNDLLHEVKIHHFGLDGGSDGSDAARGGGGGGLMLRSAHRENLLRLLRRSGISIAAPCGGSGLCGKCVVRIVQDARGLPAPTMAEAKFISDDMLNNGFRLACFYEVIHDITIELASAFATAAAQIITSGLKITLPLEPHIRKHAVKIKEQTLKNQSPDAEHALEALAELYPIYATGGSLERQQSISIAPNFYADIDILKKLPGCIHEGCGEVTFVCASGGQILGVEPGDTSAICYGVAFDLGTTTIAGYLFDMTDGREAAVASTLNPQAKYGADVITRINYASSATDATDATDRRCAMRNSAIEGLNSLLERLCLLGGVNTADIYSIYLAGNTTMLHFYMGLPADKIAIAPFIPVTTSLCYIPQHQSGLAINCSGTVACLPGVSAYVGADTLAAALACNMDESDEINILIDIGTNGEIVVGGSACLYACSTAAGPAFEGASISCGMGGVEGAIDSVSINKDGDVACTTIGGVAPIGICGSGIVDTIAQLLKAGIIDETGRLMDAVEAEAEGAPAALCRRLFMLDDGSRGFMLVPPRGVCAGADAGAGAGAGAIGGEYISQRDIRELQNAKAAIAAGVVTLLSIAGKKNSDVSHVYLAGGFGNYINIESALEIGLISRELEGRIVSAGNAAGAGVSAALVSLQAIGRISGMSRKMRYVELSASAEFTQAYIECMLFE